MKKSPKVRMKIREAKRDFSAEATYQEANTMGEGVVSSKMGMGSSMKVHHYEVIDGKRYKVLTVG